MSWKKRRNKSEEKAENGKEEKATRIIENQGSLRHTRGTRCEAHQDMRRIKIGASPLLCIPHKRAPVTIK